MEVLLNQMLSYVPKVKQTVEELAQQPMSEVEQFEADWSNGFEKNLLPSGASSNGIPTQIASEGNQDMIEVHQAYIKLEDADVMSFVKFLEKHPSVLDQMDIVRRIRVLDFMLYAMSRFASALKRELEKNPVNGVPQELYVHASPAAEFVAQLAFSLRAEAKRSLGTLGGMSNVELGLGITSIVLLLIMIIVSATL